MNFKELLIEYEEKLVVSCFSLETYLDFYSMFHREVVDYRDAMVEFYNNLTKLGQKVKPIMLATLFLHYWSFAIIKDNITNLDISKLENVFKEILDKLDGVNMKLEDLLIKYEDEIMYQCFGEVISDELYFKYTQIYPYEWTGCIEDLTEEYTSFTNANKKITPIMLTTLFLSQWKGVMTEEDFEKLDIESLEHTFRKILEELEVQ